MPLKEQPEFPALAELAKRGLLAPDTWSWKRAQISVKATIDVPMKKDGGEMLIAIVLDQPLVEAQAWVEAPDAFIQALTKIMQDKQNHPVIAQMIRPGVNDDLPPSESAASYF